ncbi:polysaccharide lyase [Leptothoe kymatousa]|uniref:Polysaccharide lyase 14 domain-containing protein n=1 Tax=Leptothoe kymatousa TAU-MAC 1615 TaxID=2364775 RepID=A0ABS5Y7C4_9CYAN|nr:polysaccharide lyase [Leptothoe kymatousa]MBT9313501.1 hypothetical protein [Leptothoe kymatousa TAU-MAC 1615]
MPPSLSETPRGSTLGLTLATAMVLLSTGCQSLEAPSAIAPADAQSSNAQLWQSDLSQADWQTNWEPREDKSWGRDNIEILPDGQTFDHILRVHYPTGSASPSVSRNTDTPLGGAQFYSDLFLPGEDRLRLTYHVRFAEDFNFVKGGKLPGLFGGIGASDGNRVDGTDGFSTRLMWRQNGQGEVYAHLPTSQNYGTSLGLGTWQFLPGTWYRIDQEVRLNHPKRADGYLRLWVNGDLVVNQAGVGFRTTRSLKIDGIFFSTFFGGGDSSWATPQATYVDFADFAISSVAK